MGSTVVSATEGFSFDGVRLPVTAIRSHICIWVLGICKSLGEMLLDRMVAPQL